jgi:hypothetical protein
MYVLYYDFIMRHPRCVGIRVWEEIKVMAGKMAKRMTGSDRTEHMNSHIKLYPQGGI